MYNLFFRKVKVKIFKFSKLIVAQLLRFLVVNFLNGVWILDSSWVLTFFLDLFQDLTSAIFEW
jgi:hypothetical protein